MSDFTLCSLGRNVALQARTVKPLSLHHTMAQRNLQGKSMFGSQPLSTRPSPANYGFGSSTRNHRNRLYIGEMYAKTSNISCTPGPCYETQGSMASQADSGKLSTPQWQFGTSQRFASPRSTLSGTPAPGTYESASSFQRQSLSQRTSFPRFGFGTVDRDMAAKVRVSPPRPACALSRAHALSRTNAGLSSMAARCRSSSRRATRPPRLGAPRPAQPPRTCARRGWRGTSLGSEPRSASGGRRDSCTTRPSRPALARTRTRGCSANSPRASSTPSRPSDSALRRESMWLVSSATT